jgi:hypothetical protein
MAYPVQKLVSAVLVAALSLNGGGCSTIPAHVAQPPSGGTAVNIAPDDEGWTRLHIIPTWSNGKSPDDYLSFRTDSADGQLLFAYERGHGLVPVTVRRAAPPKAASSSSWSLPLGVGGPDPMGAGVLIMVALVVFGVAALIKSATAQSETASSRPSPDCCFLWVENAVTGEVLAGEPPWKEPKQISPIATQAAGI